jgi:hypothetical protein
LVRGLSPDSGALAAEEFQRPVSSDIQLDIVVQRLYNLRDAEHLLETATARITEARSRVAACPAALSLPDYIRANADAFDPAGPLEARTILTRGAYRLVLEADRVRIMDREEIDAEDLASALGGLL